MKYLDLIGPKADLYMNKSKIFRTTLGGILTILVSILSILCFFGFGLDLIEKVHPETITSKDFVDYPIINKTDQFYLVGPHLSGGGSIPEIERKLNMIFTYSDTNAEERQNDQTTYFYDHPMVLCSETKYFQMNLFNVSSSMILEPSGYYCIPDSFMSNLEGKFGKSKFKLYEFYIK